MRCLKLILPVLLLCGAAADRALAFSLGGPAATWMTVRLGYDVNTQVWPGGAGWGGAGPMNIGEEYRMNFTEVSYGFSDSFLNYFGARGVLEIEKAIAVLNALPSMDTININDFPVSGQRMNHRAQALFVADIRSVALSALLVQMGLSDPTRWVYTLRNRWTIDQTTNFFVIQRNFDPDTWTYSPYINGQLWTYTSIVDGDTRSYTFNEPVDPLALGGLLNAPVAGGIVGNGFLSIGGFWTGLTRDDVGGLRYIYRHNNYNIENAPTNSVGAGLGVAVSGGDSSPWTVPVVGTNAGGVIPGTTTNFVDSALRPGIAKLNFTRLSQQSVLGPFISNNVAFSDRFITNGVERQQNLIRAQIAPDIMFDAGDLQGDDGDPGGYVSFGVASLTWNTQGDGTTTFGPGSIPPAVGATPALTFTFNTVGPTIVNAVISGQFFVSEVNNLGRFFLWGSFDGTADEPFVYPHGSSTALIEDFVLGGGGGGGGAGGALVETWTPASLVLLPPGTVISGGAGTPGDPNAGGGGGVTP